MTIAIRQIAVAREQRFITQGQTVSILAYIADISEVSLLINPTYTPLITLYAPDNSIIVNDGEMENVDVGIWRYTYQTTTDDEIGVYTVSVKAILEDAVALSREQSAFKIVDTSTLTTFTYFTIKDQDGEVWYWYVTSEGTLNSVSVIPSSPGKQAVVISGPVVEWLEVNNPTPSLRYIYPELTGEVTVSEDEPAVGSGMVGSPTLVGINGVSYTIALNVSDEVVLNVVA